jgi:enediyne biosynthesis protein E4
LSELKDQSLENSSGFWNRVASLDFDDDGDLDYVVGNAGRNLPWKVSAENPLTLYYDDFNR